MRKIFVETVVEMMQADEDIIFFTGDLGFGSFEIIQEFFPDRFYNMGIAEQNMIGTACGLSLSGKKVIVYSIANFTTLRVVEQIRNYLIYHNNHVLIVNGGGGFCYGQLGYTHHAVEDISIMKCLPYIRVFTPCEDNGIKQSLARWLEGKQTAYLRLEKASLAELSTIPETSVTEYGVLIGSAQSSNYILGYGTIIDEAVKARKTLNSSGINVTIIALTELKFIPAEIYKQINNAERVVFIEENMVQGGMGEHFFANCMLSQIKVGHSYILGINNKISETIGDQNYLRQLHGIDANAIVECFRGNYGS